MFYVYPHSNGKIDFMLLFSHKMSDFRIGGRANGRGVFASRRGNVCTGQGTEQDQFYCTSFTMLFYNKTAIPVV